jgi:lysyl-tRNA synthetase class 2
MASAEVTAGFEQLCRCSTGDIVGVVGQPLRSRRGEPSIEALEWALLAPTQFPFPDRLHRLVEPELRQRRRYLDAWVTPGTRERLRARSTVLRTLRRLLDEVGFEEVETPMLHPLAGGAAARPFRTHHHALDAEFSLRIAPELYLKRLLVAGFERVYEIGRNFRNEGISPRHNPEFTMLEAYQAYGDVTDMEALTERLVHAVCLAVTGASWLASPTGPVDLAPPWPRVAMDHLVAETLDVEFDLGRPAGEARQIAEGLLDRPVPGAWGAGRILVEVFEQLVEPRLTGPVFVTDHPLEVSPLARPHRSRPGHAERFEAYLGGMEIANGYSELNDPDAQLAAFAAQAADPGDIDMDYVEALRFAMPPAGGVGIGIDRLLMVCTGASSIRDVIAFPTLRPRPAEPDQTE